MTISRMRAKGQLTIPRELREAAHLEDGDPVEIEMTGEGILLRPKKLIDATQAWFWTRSWQAGEARAQADIDAGRTKVHSSTDEFLAALGE